MHKLTIVLSFLLIPPGVRPAIADLVTRVEVSQSSASYTYTVFNDEPLGSPNHVNVFHLNVAAPITITGTPAGWEFTTDNATFVGWFNTDIEPPYSNDIPPQGSMTFSIASTVSTTELLRYTVGSWDHVADTAGPSYRDVVLAPAVQAIPEPSGVLFFGLAFAVARVILTWARGSESDFADRQ